MTKTRATPTIDAIKRVHRRVAASMPGGTTKQAIVAKREHRHRAIERATIAFLIREGVLVVEMVKQRDAYHFNGQRRPRLLLGEVPLERVAPTPKVRRLGTLIPVGAPPPKCGLHDDDRVPGCLICARIAQLVRAQHEALAETSEQATQRRHQERLRAARRERRAKRSNIPTAAQVARYERKLVRDRERYQQRREAVLALRKEQRRSLTPEQRERIRARQKAWRAANPGPPQNPGRPGRPRKPSPSPAPGAPPAPDRVLDGLEGHLATAGEGLDGP